MIFLARCRELRVFHLIRRRLTARSHIYCKRKHKRTDLFSIITSLIRLCVNQKQLPVQKF